MRYKLLKDFYFPLAKQCYFPAYVPLGTIVVFHEGNDEFSKFYHDEKKQVRFHPSMVEDNEKWFEKID